MALTHQLYHTDIKIGEDAQTKIDFETANEIHFDADNAERVKIDSTGLNVVSGSIETATIDYTDGDLSMTIADGGKVTFSAGFAVGSDAAGDILYHNGTSYIRLAKGAADTVLTMNDAANAPGWEAAAGGGDSHDFVADGAISDGDAVALTSAGKVKSVVSEVNNDPVTWESAATRYSHTAYDTTNDKFVVVYRDEGNSDYGTAVVGTVASSSGHPVTFGTPVVFESASSAYHNVVFDSNAEKFVISYRDAGNSNYGTAIVGTVSGTSISFGTPAVFESAATQLMSMAFDPDNNKVGIFFQDVGSGGAGTGIVGTVSGTDISFGSATQFDTANSYIWNNGATYDTTANKFVVAYQDDGAATGQCVVATISGTSISFGTVATFLSGNRAFDVAAAYDATANKTVIAYRDANNGDYGTAIVGTVSGTDITFGSSAVFHAYDVNSDSINAAYVTNRGKVIITYDSNSAAISPAQSRGEYLYCTITGTTPSFSDNLVFSTNSVNYSAAAYDPDNGVVLVVYEDDDDSDYGKAVVIDTAVTTNYTDFIGFASAAISDTATGTIDILGTVNESQSSLTVGSRYYMNNFAALTTTSIANREVGLALSATKMLVTGNNLS